MAGLVAAVFGTAAASPGRDGRVEAVLSASYVDPADESTVSDQVARGLAVVVTTGARLDRLPGSRTIGAWARQMAAREAQVGPIGDRLRSLVDDAADADPLAGLVTVIAARGDGRAAAELLAGRPAWTVLLARDWADGGTAFAGTVDVLAQAAGQDARTAIRSGLGALGDGLQDGHPDDRTVDRRTADAVAPALGRAVEVHIGAITGVLAEVADSCPPPDRLATLHGLGYLTIDDQAAAAVMAGLRAWSGRPVPRALASGGEAVLVAVPAAFLAVQHYGQRLHFALDSHVRKEEAERRARRWEMTAGLLFAVVENVVGKRIPAAEPLVAAVEEEVQGWVGADGTWDLGEDEGDHYTGADASVLVTSGRGERGEDGLRHIARAGAEVFARARETLGEPVVATPDEDDLPIDRIQDLGGRRSRVHAGPR